MASQMARFSLTLLGEGKLTRRDIDLDDGDRIVIGRSSKSDRKLLPSSNNCRFDCPVVSRSHAVLLCNDGEISVRDTGSLHGTWVNEEQLTDGNEVVLQDGDIIKLGAEVLRGQENFQAVRLVVNHYRQPPSEHLPSTYGYDSDFVEEEDEDEEEDIIYGMSSHSFAEGQDEMATPEQSKVGATLVVPESIEESYLGLGQSQSLAYHNALPESGSVHGTGQSIVEPRDIDDEPEQDEVREESDRDQSWSDDGSDSGDEHIHTDSIVAPVYTSSEKYDGQPFKNAVVEPAFTDQQTWEPSEAGALVSKVTESPLVASLPTPPTTHNHSSGQWYDPVRSAHQESFPESIEFRDVLPNQEFNLSIPTTATVAKNPDVLPVQDSVAERVIDTLEKKKRKHCDVERASTAQEEPATKKLAVAQEGQLKPQASRPIRRLRTLPSRATVRKVATQVSHVTAGAVLGMVGTVAFLSSPYAEQLIRWLD
ncbi:uncharacterized protein K489DRAFT_408121 [Dissoconium aciculare CBS 342.82]|uniref:FHA domain-containing protein n=1 Tax=Dissoconium aciculare CBS 342.82 TaxID=1314786 RepID=A0A6J3MBT9_9PEZI|nr:uncharacterized protein K489DRAFT_408121 [Dissoconium aciculare CBS 342.82]KAF1825465.1 hypothetical protein K489DRAFT_408121 [Dissoconium aciculare CBS 342.82]